MGAVWKSIVEFVFGLLGGLPRSVVLVILLGLFFALAIAGRCGFAGATASNALWRIFPYSTPADCERSKLIASLRFLVWSGNEYVPGGLGSEHPPGTNFRLQSEVSEPSWVYIFSLDASGEFHLFPSDDSRSALYFDGSTSIELDYQLDDTAGRELYALVASRRPFSWEEMTSELLIDLASFSRGPDLANHLQNTERFTVATAYFSNTGLR